MLASFLCALALAATPADGGSPSLLPPRVVPLLSAHGKSGPSKVATSGLKLEPKTAPAANAPSFSARLGVDGDVLLVSVDVADPKPGPQDALALSLQFPAAAASGVTYRFGPDGRRTSRPEDHASESAQAAVKTTVEKTPSGFVVTARLPLQSFPRFPVKDDLTAQLCLTLTPAPPAKELSTCASTPTPDDWVTLPNALRDQARQQAFGALARAPRPKTKKPKSDGGDDSPVERMGVVSLEPRPGGWAGYDLLHFPIFLSASEAITPELLGKLVGEPEVSPGAVRLAVPSKLATPDGSLLDFYLTGQDPFSTEGKCQGDRELRLALFLINGKTATRALEWPASTCALGRASSVSLEDDGALTIGYASGATVSFTWSRDHFERTQLGER